jgi:hypothetical protein
MSAADIVRHQRLTTIGWIAKAAAVSGMTAARRRFAWVVRNRPSLPVFYVLQRTEHLSIEQLFAAGPRSNRFFTIAGSRAACG